MAALQALQAPSSSRPKSRGSRDVETIQLPPPPKDADLSQAVRDLIEPSLNKWFGISAKGKEIDMEGLGSNPPKFAESETLCLYINISDTEETCPILFEGFGIHGSIFMEAASREVAGSPFVAALRSVPSYSPEDVAVIVTKGVVDEIELGQKNNALPDEIRKLIEPTLQKWFGISEQGRAMISDVKRSPETTDTNVLLLNLRCLDTGVTYLVAFDCTDFEGEVSILVTREELINSPYLVAINALERMAPEPGRTLMLICELGNEYIRREI